MCLSVCVSVCPVRALTSDSLDLETSFLVRRYPLRISKQVRRLCQGYQVKVKVTKTKRMYERRTN